MKVNFDHSKRIKRLRKLLQQHRLEAHFINKKERIYYLTGYNHDDAYLLLSEKHLLLITDSRYQQEVVQSDFPFKVTIAKNKLETVKSFVKENKIRYLGFEEDFISYKLYKRLKSLSSKLKLTASQKFIDSLTIVKDSDEIKAIKQATKITQNTLSYFKNIKKVGLSEKQIRNMLDCHMLKLKAESSAFKTMVLSGSRTASAHAQSSSVKIDKSANLLIDLGAKIYGYNSDLTRIYHLSKISKRFKEFCTAVKKAQNEAIAAVKPQVKASKIDNITRKIFAEYGFEKYIIHATGHGIGLFVHEKPYINHKNHLRLKPGMVFTIEPGLYLPGEFGIRLEDVVLVTKSGHKVLSNDIPKSI